VKTRTGRAAGELPGVKPRAEKRRTRPPEKNGATVDVLVNDASAPPPSRQATTYGNRQVLRRSLGAGPLMAAELEALGKALDRAEARWWRSLPVFQGLH